MFFPKLFLFLISLHSISCGDVSDGILVIGSGGSEPRTRSVEFWSAADPEEGSCQLNDYPREMDRSSMTANVVSGQVVACYLITCEVYQGGNWNHLQSTMSFRRDLTSAANDEAILLIGGSDTNSTEWVPIDGSPARPGPFFVRHGAFHCTIQLTSDVIVVTGGDGTMEYVTEYHLTGDSKAAPLSNMQVPRFLHACGAYQDAGGQQVLLVTGGGSSKFGTILSSTEVATYSSGSQLKWREVESGQLPSPRQFLQATSVDNVLFITGGEECVDGACNDFTSILSWDPVAETWQGAGNLSVARHSHAAVAVPSPIIVCSGC